MIGDNEFTNVRKMERITSKALVIRRTFTYRHTKCIQQKVHTSCISSPLHPYYPQRLLVAAWVKYSSCTPPHFVYVKERVIVVGGQRVL